jgi:hypothetical protein
LQRPGSARRASAQFHEHRKQQGRERVEQDGPQPLSELRVVDTDHGRIKDIPTLDRQVLDLQREDVLPP